MAGDPLEQLDQQLNEVQATVVTLTELIERLEQAFERLFSTASEGKFPDAEFQEASRLNLEKYPDLWNESTSEISGKDRKELTESIKLIHDKRDALTRLVTLYETLKKQSQELTQATIAEDKATEALTKRVRQLNKVFTDQRRAQGVGAVEQDIYDDLLKDPEKFTGKDIVGVGVTLTEKEIEKLQKIGPLLLKNHDALEKTKAKKEELTATTLELIQALEKEATALSLPQDASLPIKQTTEAVKELKSEAKEVDIAFDNFREASKKTRELRSDIGDLTASLRKLGKKAETYSNQVQKVLSDKGIKEPKGGYEESDLYKKLIESTSLAGIYDESIKFTGGDVGGKPVEVTKEELDRLKTLGKALNSVAEEEANLLDKKQKLSNEYDKQIKLEEELKKAWDKAGADELAKGIAEEEARRKELTSTLEKQKKAQQELTEAKKGSEETRTTEITKETEEIKKQTKAQQELAKETRKPAEEEKASEEDKTAEIERLAKAKEKLIEETRKQALEEEKITAELKKQAEAKKQAAEESRQPDIEAEEVLKERVEAEPPKKVVSEESKQKIKELNTEILELKRNIKIVDEALAILLSRGRDKAGGGTQQGWEDSVERLKQDPETWGGRIGGGDRIQGEERRVLQERQTSINTYTDSLEEIRILKATLLAGEKEITEAVKDTGKAAEATQRIQKESQKSTKEVVDALESGADEAIGEVEDIGLDNEELKKDAAAVKTLKEEIKEYAELIAVFGDSITKQETSSKSFANGLREFSTAGETAQGATFKLNTVLDEMPLK
jgi:hypothetical protein